MSKKKKKRNFIIGDYNKKKLKDQNSIIYWIICHYSWLKILKEKYMYINELLSIKY